MDLNELLYAHQVEVMKATASGNDDDRQGHFDRVALYAKRIRELRESFMTNSPIPLTESGETIIYGTYAGDPLPDQDAATPDPQKSEGSSLDGPDVPLPPGITVTLRREYHVGRYVYSDLMLAIAESERQRTRLRNTFAPPVKPVRDVN